MTRASSSSRLMGSDPGRVELAANVDDVGTLGFKLQRLRYGGVWCQKVPAVREAVGRHVDDAHEPRPVECQPGDRRPRLSEPFEQFRRDLTPGFHSGEGPAADLAPIALDQLCRGKLQVDAPRHGNGEFSPTRGRRNSTNGTDVNARHCSGVLAKFEGARQDLG